MRVRQLGVPPEPSADTLEGLIEARKYLLDEIKQAFPGSGHKKALEAIDEVVRAEIRGWGMVRRHKAK